MKTNKISVVTKSAPLKVGQFGPLREAIAFYVGNAMESAREVIAKFKAAADSDPTYAFRWHAAGVCEAQEMLRRLRPLADASKLDTMTDAELVAGMVQEANEVVDTVLRWKPTASTSVWANVAEDSQHMGYRAYGRLLEEILKTHLGDGYARKLPRF